MLKKPYSLWKRRLPSGRHVYYARFRLENGRWSVAKSTGQSTKTAAEAWAIEYLKTGPIVVKERVLFEGFAKDFFTPEGLFVRSRRIRGRLPGKNHLANLQAYVRNYLLPYFGKESLSRITTLQVEEFTQELVQTGLSTSTINHILTALKLIFQEAYRKQYMKQIPGVAMVAQKHRNRGMLTMEEARAFFASAWDDPRLEAIHLLAATTGMRLGEIRGLQRSAVKPGYVEIRTSWEKGQGLKGTKTGRPRIVPLPERTEQALHHVMTLSPYQEPEDLVFLGRFRNRPLDHKVIENSFRERLAAIGIGEEERRSRGLCFHSWRHFFNSLLINHRIPVPKVQSLVGHTTSRMTETYYHPDEYRDVLEVTRRIVW